MRVESFSQNKQSYLKNTVLETPSTLADEIHDAEKALSLFLNSRFSDAEELLRPKFQQTLYHTHGTAVIAFLKAMMSFSKEDIITAKETLNEACLIASQLRKKGTHLTYLGSITDVLTSFVRYNVHSVASMTEEQKHAELVFAEAQLLKSIVCLIQDDGLVSFMKEALNFKSSYNIYMLLFKYLESEGVESDEALDCDDFANLGNSESPHFTSGIALGIAMFNLVLSLLPAKAIRAFEFIGFSADRRKALKILRMVGCWDTDKAHDYVTSDDGILIQSYGIRRPLCDIAMLGYHMILGSTIQTPDLDLTFAKRILDNAFHCYPNGVIFYFFSGRYHQNVRLIREAIQFYKKALSIQIEWKQFNHLCHWDIAQSNLGLGNHREALASYTTLLEESNWSKAVYQYQKAICMYCLNEGNFEQEFDNVATHCKRIAGKSIPIEVLLRADIEIRGKESTQIQIARKPIVVS